MTYLGGVFYSIDLLPKFWQTISLANPIFYMVNAFRQGMIGVSDIDVRLAFGVIVLFIAVLFIAALVMMHRGTGLRT